MAGESLLSTGRMADWTYTANAATSNRSKSYKENRIMRKIFKSHGEKSLFPAEETVQDANRKNEIE